MIPIRRIPGWLRFLFGKNNLKVSSAEINQGTGLVRVFFTDELCLVIRPILDSNANTILRIDYVAVGDHQRLFYQVRPTAPGRPGKQVLYDLVTDWMKIGTHGDPWVEIRDRYFLARRYAFWKRSQKLLNRVLVKVKKEMDLTEPPQLLDPY